MSSISTKPAGVDIPLSGSAIVDRVKESGIDFVVSVPDIVTCETVLWPMTNDPGLTVVPVCKEDEGVSICAGLSYCERRALLLIQHTGFLDSINAIQAIAVNYRLPICMMVGLQGMEPDRELKDSMSSGIRIMEPILDSMGIDYGILKEGADVESIIPAINRAYGESRPFVFLVARSPV
jgi:sulfopyruvate decarboxylase TPP-binding subunit